MGSACPTPYSSVRVHLPPVPVPHNRHTCTLPAPLSPQRVTSHHAISRGASSPTAASAGHPPRMLRLARGGDGRRRRWSVGGRAALAVALSGGGPGPAANGAPRCGWENRAPPLAALVLCVRACPPVWGAESRAAPGIPGVASLAPVSAFLSPRTHPLGLGLGSSCTKSVLASTPNVLKKALDARPCIPG